MKILLALLLFGVLIFVHEIGHFIAARVFGVKVNEFAIGMGPKIFSRTGKKSGTVYSLRVLPIGGFNSMEGENGDSGDESAFCAKPVWQRMIIIVSGAFLNILFAAIIMCVVVIGTDKLGSTVVAGVRKPEAQVEQSESDDSEDNGIADVTVSNTYEKFQVGDRILKIDGKRVHIVDDLVYTVAFRCTEPVNVTVMRDGKTVILEDVIFPTYESGGITFGSVDFTVLREAKNFLTVIKHSFFKCISSMEMCWESFAGLLTGRYGLDQVSGPIGITEALGEATKSGWTTVLNMLVLISMNLGIFNLLPIPALDGGRFAFLLIEAIRRKPVRQEIEAIVHTVGILVLMLIMLIVACKDVFTIIKP